MTTVFYIYYLLMAICFVISFFAFKIDKKIWPLSILFAVSLSVEIYTEFLLADNRSHFFLYHYFTPIEYSLIALYLALFAKKKLRLAIIVSMFFFWVIFFIHTDTVVLQKFPALMNNIESVLLVMWSVAGLLSINPESFKLAPLSRICFFWACVAILVYFNGTFFFDGFYNTLREKSKNAEIIYQIVHAVFNYIFYILMAWAMINLWRVQKYYKRSY